MGRVSPGMAGGLALISSISRVRARATRSDGGCSRVTVIAAGVGVMVPARPRMMVSRVMARYSSSSREVGVEVVWIASARRCARGAAGPSAGRGARRAAPRSARRGRCCWRAVSRGPACGPVTAAASALRARVMAACWPGMRSFLAAGVRSGSASRAARSRSAAARVFLRVADGGVRLLAGRVADRLGVLLDGGEVVADLVYPVVLAGVLEEVLFPPPGLQPGQDLRRARLGVRGQDLQRDPAVLEQGDLPGVAVVLELHRLLGPRDLPGPAAVADRR